MLAILATISSVSKARKKLSQNLRFSTGLFKFVQRLITYTLSESSIEISKQLIFSLQGRTLSKSAILASQKYLNLALNTQIQQSEHHIIWLLRLVNQNLTPLNLMFGLQVACCMSFAHLRNLLKLIIYWDLFSKSFLKSIHHYLNIYRTAKN